MQGKIIADNEYPLNPGEYSHFTKDDPGIWWPGKPYWMVCSPNGLRGNLVNHIVRENEDGTITVQPEPTSSNSILIEAPGRSHDSKWHGYINHGVWREA